MFDPTVDQIKRLRAALVLTGHSTGESLETFGADFVNETMRLVDYVNYRLPQVYDHAASAPDPVKALESVKAKFEKVALWLEMLASCAERDAGKPGHFLSLKDALMSDAKNYRAVAKEIRSEIENIDASISTGDR